jgi:putative flippase GtrA
MTDYSLLFRFLIVGGSTAAIFFGLTFILVETLDIATVLASTIACATAICYNYLLHYHWTFASDSPHGLTVIRYLFMSACGLLINGLIMQFGTSLAITHYMVVQIIAGFAMVCWSICMSYFWVFRSNR